MVSGHQLDSLAPQDAHAVEFTITEQHLAETQVISGGRDQATAAGQERRLRPEATSLRIVYQDESLAGVPAITRGESFCLLIRHHEGRVGHAERFEDRLTQIVVKPLTRDDLDESSAD